MVVQENILYSLRNLEKRRSRSFLTIISIFIGIATIFIFVSFGLGLYDYVNSFTTSGALDKIVVQAKGSGAPGTSPFKLTNEDLDTVRKTAGVFETEGMYFKVATINHDNKKIYTYLIGMDPKSTLFTDISNIEITKGRNLKKGDSGKVVLGFNYMQPNKIFENPLSVNDKIEINNEKYEIIGFYEEVGNPQDDSQTYITNEQFENLFPGTSYAMIVAQVDLKTIEQVVDRVEKELRKERNQEEGKEDFFVSTFEDQIAAFTGALDVVVGFIVLIALISVIVSAVNTANTMVTSVIERTREIGVLKSIGAKNASIFSIFLFESSFLGFAAGIVGILVGFIITFIAGRILASLGWSFLAPHYSPALFIGCTAFATIVGAVSGVAPAIAAAQKNPVEALRYE